MKTPSSLSKAFAVFAMAFVILRCEALEIQIPAKPLPTERTAAFELANYIKKITGKKPSINFEGKAENPPVIYLGNTKIAEKNKLTGLERQQWIIKSVGNDLIINGGGTPGPLYGMWHYLEDCAGVRFWNQDEELIPTLKEMPLKNINLGGKPAFDYRYIAFLYMSDNGRYGSKFRSHDAFPFIYQPKPNMRYYGLESEFGSPGNVHTFFQYVDYEKDFKDHPEWFPLINGKRFGAKGGGGAGTQICLSNKEMRKEVIKRMRAYIKADREKADKMGYPYPTAYDFSINDNGKKCECENCKALTKKYEADSGLLIECLNEFAADLKKDYPEIVLHTYAYIYTETPPKNIKPADNICITLCDTTSSIVDPITSDINKNFREKLKAWAAFAPKLRIWKYGITYTKPAGLPIPSEFIYADDLKFYRDNKVKSLFLELESPIASDVNTYKMYMWRNLSENPDADVKKLMNDFAYGYFGAAGKYFLEYRELLHKLQRAGKVFISPYSTSEMFTYIDFENFGKMQALFDAGEKLIANDKVLLRRWKHARMPLDRAVNLKRREFIREWLAKGNKFADYPYSVEKYWKRVEEVLNEQTFRKEIMPYYLNQNIKMVREEKNMIFEELTEKSVRLPEKFKNMPVGSYFDFPVDRAYRHRDAARIENDDESETGKAVVMRFPNHIENNDVSRYNKYLPMGCYSMSHRRNLGGGAIHWNMVKNRGYNWYKIGKTKLAPDCYIYFFTTWVVQLNVGYCADIINSDTEYEIWVKVKFTGPEFPLGKKGEKDAVYLERVVLKKIQK